MVWRRTIAIVHDALSQMRVGNATLAMQQPVFWLVQKKNYVIKNYLLFN
jgi:hypothetical protein